MAGGSAFASTKRLEWAAWALFRRDGFDDEAAGLLWIEWDIRAVKRGIHEGDDFGIVESGGAF